MTGQTRLRFELDQRTEAGTLTAYGGVPLLTEAFRVSGAAGVLDERMAIKRRKRGLCPSELVEGCSRCGQRVASGARISMRCADAALALLLGHGIAAPQTAREFLKAFDQTAPPLWQGETCHVQGEGERLQGLTAASRRLVVFLQERRPQATATIDLDATILESHKQSAKATYNGRRGYQPVIALWAEQDVVLADEFRDGDVPAGAANQRLIERAVAHLPPGIGRILVRADSAAYDQGLLRWLDGAGHGYAISADMSRELAAALRALPEAAWLLARISHSG